MNGNYRISLAGISPKVEIDGKPLEAPIRGVRIMQNYGEFPILELLLDARSIEIEGHGTVNAVQIAGPGSVEAFLDTLDADEIEQEALTNTDFGTSVSRSILNAIRERASGRT